MLKRIINKIFLTKEIREQTGALHFRRWCLFVLPWFRIYLHEISLPDYDQHRHSHPWNFFSFIIKGSYLETWCKGPAYDKVFASSRKKFSLAHHDRTDVHRIESMKAPVWTLVFAYGKYQAWGYRLWSPQDKAFLGWMDHVSYRKAKRDGMFDTKARRVMTPEFDLPENPKVMFLEDCHKKHAEFLKKIGYFK